MSLIQKTNNYDLFKFRKDNRAIIQEADIRKMVQSITQSNLLHLHPIIVNEEFEIINGQHRVLAAQRLGVEIYYQVVSGVTPDDIIKMNLSKSWTASDYLNFYCYHEYPEYLKLKQFMEKNGMSLKNALYLTMGKSEGTSIQYKFGKYIFVEMASKDTIGVIKETISLLRKSNGPQKFTDNARFWKALARLIEHPDFNFEKWFRNVTKLCTRFTVKATAKDYCNLVQSVYNYHSVKPIHLNGHEYE